MKSYTLYGLILFSFICTNQASTIETTEVPVVTQTTEEPIVTTTSKPNKACSNFTTCEDCLKASKECYFCHTNSTSGVCVTADPPYVFNLKCSNLKHTYYVTCKINFEVFLILVGIAAGVVVISLCTCCCCLCCCGSKRKGLPSMGRLGDKWEREREARRLRQEERHRERQAKNDDIRRKYGLIREDNPYQRFDN